MCQDKITKKDLYQLGFKTKYSLVKYLRNNILKNLKKGNGTSYGR